MKKRFGLFSIYGLAVLLAVILLVSLPACSSDTTSTTSVTQAPAVKLVFTSQPTEVQAGVYFPEPLVVESVDANGNVTGGSTRQVKLTVADVSGSEPVIIFGSMTALSEKGIFTFNELSIDKSGSYIFTAESTGLEPAVSDPVNISGFRGIKLVFSSRVVNAVAGSSFTVVPTVSVVDMYGNLSTDTQADITLGMVPVTTESYAAVLSGVTRVKMVNGVASFPGISIDIAGTFALTATGSNLGATASNLFEITPAEGVKLFFNTQPLTVPAGSHLTEMPPAIAVLVQDAYGNTVRDLPVEVTITITPGTGADGAVLSGVTKLITEDGVASFLDLTIDTVGTGYTLTVTGGGLASAVSDSFDITPAEEAAAESSE